MLRSFTIFVPIIAACLTMSLLLGGTAVSQVPAKPMPTPGRYQVEALYNGGLIYIDTTTGQLWYGTINAANKDAWTTIAPPVDEPK